MTAVDWFTLAFAGLLAIAGAAKGLVAGALSLAGVVVGAVVGARLAPHLLPHGDRSPYTPLIALGGAVLLAVLLEGVGSLAGSFVRSGLRITPLRALDSAGGLALGAATGLAIVWVLGAVALLFPGQATLRDAAQRSVILQRLNEIVPPRRLLNALARVDPFQELLGPFARVEPPDASVLRNPVVRRAGRGVVRVLGTACGLGVEGSGWVAGPGVVVTAAHVVAGTNDTVVRPSDSPVGFPARAVAFDPRNDVAVLRVQGDPGRPLPLADPRAGTPVAILGYPNNGPLTATPGRIGQTTKFLTRDAYGEGPVLREITTFRGRIRHGNSGGPAVDASGRVETTVFAARTGSAAGYGVPTSLVRDALRDAKRPVSTGPCAR